MKWIKLFEEYNKVNEKLTDVNDDVDWIYDKYFKEAYDYIKNYDKVNLDLLRSDDFSSSELQSPLCKKAHSLNPVTFYINDNTKYRSNHYNPFENIINLRPNSDAIEFAVDKGSISKASEYLGSFGQKDIFLREFKESSMKGSIHHELVHWIDDTMNNQHIKKKLQKQKDSKIKIKNVNFTNFELQSQIHNIVQLKRKYEDIWDELTFDEMIKLSTSLTTVMKNVDSDEKKDWLFRLKKRMFREGILGKKMK